MKTKIDARGGDPLFPMIASNQVHATGMSKRELFAAMAMQAIATNAGRNGFAFHGTGLIAKKAVEIADNLLSELSKQE